MKTIVKRINKTVKYIIMTSILDIVKGRIIVVSKQNKNEKKVKWSIYQIIIFYIFPIVTFFIFLLRVPHNNGIEFTDAIYNVFYQFMLALSTSVVAVGCSIGYVKSYKYARILLEKRIALVLLAISIYFAVFLGLESFNCLSLVMMVLFFLALLGFSFLLLKEYFAIQLLIESNNLKNKMNTTHFSNQMSWQKKTVIS